MQPLVYRGLSGVTMRVDLSLVNYLETSGISAGSGRLEGRSHLLSAGGSGTNSERASWTVFSELPWQPPHLAGSSTQSEGTVNETA